MWQKECADKTVERIAFIKSCMCEDKGCGLKLSTDRTVERIAFIQLSISAIHSLG